MSNHYIVPLVLLNQDTNPHYYPDVLIGTNVEYKCFDIDKMSCKIKVEEGVSVPMGTAITEEQYNLPCGE